MGHTCTIEFHKSILEINNGPPRKIFGYICGNKFVNGYQLIQFKPACLYISYKNTTNFKLLGAKVCIHSNDTIIEDKST